MGHMTQGGAPKLLSATGIISEAAGTLLGFYVASTSAGTLIFNVGGASGATTGGTAITGTITPAIGWHGLPVDTPNRMYVTIGGTISVTPVFAAG